MADCFIIVTVNPYIELTLNSGKQKVDNILNGIKWISKGGY